MKNIPYILLITVASLYLSCNENSDDDSAKSENDCPAKNTTTPQIFGEWLFTGTVSGGQLLVEHCDLKTKLTVTETQFIWDNFSGGNCEILTVIPTCYAIENGEVFFFNELDEKNGFSQKIKTLNDNTLVLENRNTTTIVSTENYERIK
ncbi:hypothetical protein ABI125_14125 [Tamlana crocina]